MKDIIIAYDGEPAHFIQICVLANMTLLRKLIKVKHKNCKQAMILIFKGRF